MGIISLIISIISISISVIVTGIPFYCKYIETRPILDGFRKNNVNYWAFREIRSIIPHL